MQISGRNWYKTVRHPSTLLYRYLSMLGHTSKYFETSIGIGLGINTALSVDHQSYLLLEEYTRVKSFLEERATRDTSFFYEHIALCDSHLNQLLAVARTLAAENSWSSMDNHQLADSYELYMHHYLNAVPFKLTFQIMDRDVLYSKIMSRLGPRLSKLNNEEAKLQGLIIQKQENFFAKELKELTELALEVQITPELGAIFTVSDNREIAYALRKSFPYFLSRLESHTVEYGWFNMVRNEREPWGIDDVLQRLKERMQENASELLWRKHMQREKAYAHRQNLIRELALDPGELELLDIAGQYAYFRTYRSDVFHISDYLIHPLLREIASRCNLAYNQLVFLIPSEFLSALRAGTTIPINDVGARQASFAVILEGGNFQILTGDEILEVEDQLSFDASNEIKGLVASSGYTKGRVVIVRSKADSDKIIEGDIVIGPTTLPELALAFSRAAAIVTDEGGMLSHAAIISRELGIPCIVGTDHATRLLHDGDVVEVDATKAIGRVNVISRAQPPRS